MKRLALTLTAATLALGMTVLAASAQTQQPGAASLHAQIKNATPIVTQTACHGPGAHCRAGFVQRCGFPRFPHCRCVPCM
jgi:hypothetical protein